MWRGGAADAPPEKLVPTQTILRRASLANLASPWWQLQLDGKLHPSHCLEIYGKQYAKFVEKHCGQHRAGYQRCVKAKKMDALNMSQWYPHCGEDYEKEHACAIAAVRVVDDKCREQLDEAARRFKDFVPGSNSEDKRRDQAVFGLRQCISGLTVNRAVTLSYDTAAAKERYEASKRLMQ
mmetsp:Transcript_29257/g.67357  ORF Transcript_29257/g.67357 Transcript_29257/m.67357 type:complete len:180 (-) Transcript_29257:46-585(-)